MVLLQEISFQIIDVFVSLVYELTILPLSTTIEID